MASVVLDRFWSKVDQRGPDDCWEWRAARMWKGYGHFGVARDLVVRAHRFAWEVSRGPIPNGAMVLHRCDNPACCNPAHLFLGTARDNTDDMVAKGRMVPPPTVYGDEWRRIHGKT